MKIDRLIGIIATLQQRGQVTAPYLAEKFEVSRRTISRDMEDICRAGIPIVTTRGGKGGYALMTGFSLDTTVFTAKELSAILTGLKTLDSVSRRSQSAPLAEKIGAPAQDAFSGGMSIDLASFYKGPLTEKIEAIRAAIEARHCIAFHYYYNKGEADKVIDPYAVLFRWSDWYVFGFCHERQDFRMYKLRRLWALHTEAETYTPRPIPEEKLHFGSHMTDDYFVTALYDPAAKYRLVEEYGPESFTVLPDGRLHTRWGFTTREAALEWLLSFGDRVQVTDPPEMVALMRDTLQKMLSNHPEQDMPVS